MRQTKVILMQALLTITVMFTACNKETISHSPGNHGGGAGNPGTQNPDSSYKVKVKATITIGDIMYDSIPASLEITSWDSNNASHQRKINLVAGVNEIFLPKAHTRYKLRLSKWGISDEMTFTRAQVQEGTVIGLGGTKVARKLRLEEGYLFAAGSYQPDNKTIYTYNPNGTIKQIDYYQKRPQHSDLKRFHYDVFIYAGNRVDKIDRFDEAGAKVGITDFTYNSQGKVTNIHQKSYDQETGAAVEYGNGSGYSTIDIYYLYNNGNTMAYNMKFKGGNKVQDAATTSLGKSENGVYVFDFNINPFAHMNMPNLFLSNISKNNLISQQKSYSGSIPSGEPYKYEYSYDAEGYPAVLIKSYKSYLTGAHLYNTKTVYTY